MLAGKPQKSFLQFLLKLRVSHSVRLLDEERNSEKQSGLGVEKVDRNELRLVAGFDLERLVDNEGLVEEVFDGELLGGLEDLRDPVSPDCRHLHVLIADPHLDGNLEEQRVDVLQGRYFDREFGGRQAFVGLYW